MSDTEREYFIQYGRDDVDYHTWYGDFPKRLAKMYTREELAAQLHKARGAMPTATTQHLRAVSGTTSMHSKSQRRAQSRNVVQGASETCLSLRVALEIHDLFPEHALHPAPAREGM